MNAYPAGRYRQYAPSHPGGLVGEGIEALGKSKAEIARLLGISRQHLYDIVNEKKPITPTVAARIGKLFGDGAEIWLRMQASHDAWHAEHNIDLSSVPTLSVPHKTAAE